MNAKELIGIINALAGEDQEAIAGAADKIMAEIFGGLTDEEIMANIDGSEERELRLEKCISEAMDSGEVNVVKVMPEFIKQVISHDKHRSEFWNDIEASDEQMEVMLKNSRVNQAVTKIIAHCGPGAVEFKEQFAEMIQVEDSGEMIILHGLKSLACSALASMGHVAKSEFQIIYKYVLEEDDLVGKSAIAKFCACDEELFEALLDDVIKLEGEALCSHVELISFVARENGQEVTGGVKDLFVGLLDSEDQDLVYIAIEYLNETAGSDEAIQDLINEAHSQMDEEEEDMTIDAADFDYVYEGQSFAYWLELYLENREDVRAYEIVYACFNGHTSTDFMESKNLDEGSHDEELKSQLKWCIEKCDDVAKLYAAVLKGLYADLVRQGAINLMKASEKEMEEFSLLCGRAQLAEKILIMMGPLVPSAIKSLEGMKNYFLKSEQNAEIFSKLVAECDFESSALPGDLVQHWLGTKNDHRPNYYTLSVASICAKDPSLLKVVEDVLLEGNAVQYELISGLIAQNKEGAISLVDSVLKVYENKGGERSIISSLAVFSHYDSRAEKIVRSMLLSEDRDLRSAAIYHSSLLSNENVELVINALSDVDEYCRMMALQRVKELAPDKRIAERLVEMLEDDACVHDWGAVAEESLEVLLGMSEFVYLSAAKLCEFLAEWLSCEQEMNRKNKDSYKTGATYGSSSMWELDDLVAGFEAMGEHANMAEKEIREVVDYLSTREASGAGTRVMKLKNILALIGS